ncbi:MAG: Zn-dependent exopeptidase M28 [Oscillospiraceae bacterium]|nr:Zn-dependent exopeptidase M28 [Oscillospiraceae bacterium]
MNQRRLRQIFKDTDYVHRSGTPEELRAAETLKAQCEALGVPARLESFRVAMAEIEEAVVLADGKPIPAAGIFGCGSGEVEGELYYLPAYDPVSVAGAKDKIVLLDRGVVGYYPYQDLMKAGARGILFQYGNRFYPNDDVDLRDLREAVVGEARKVLCAMVSARTAVELVKKGVRRIRISIRQREFDGESHNVIAEIPGKRGDFIALTAHYDTTALSHGAYDNMSGCAGLLGVMEKLKALPLNTGLRFIFCGSEERGLLGSKAYVRDHEAELESIVLNVNLDMIGSVMGRFIARVSAEEALASYLRYMGAELSFPVAAKTGVYSSDSTPFADKGVPAVSLARIARTEVAPIHGRYDRMELLSMEQLQRDIDFIAEFTRRMATAAVCPVSREIPEMVRKELDEYLFRKRRPTD